MNEDTTLEYILENGYVIEKMGIKLCKKHGAKGGDFPYSVDVSDSALAGYKCGGNFSNSEMAINFFQERINDLRAKLLEDLEKL